MNRYSPNNIWKKWYSLLFGLILIILFFVAGCSIEFMTDSPQGAQKLGATNQQPEKSKQNDSEKTIQLLNDRYVEINNLDVSQINCSDSKYYGVDLMNISINNWVDESQSYQTATWYPSLNEGRLGSLLLGEMRNIGCTKIYPVYITFVEFNDQIIFISKESDFPFNFRGIWYPEDWSEGGSFSISGDILEPLVVRISGSYTVWVQVSNKNTNSLVALEKITLTME